MSNISLADLSNQMAEAVDRAAPHVLSVRSRRWRPAAGIVFADEHLIVADHAVEHEEEISVRSSDGRTLPATVAGRDASSNLAVLKVAGLGAPPLPPSPASPRVGQIVLAVGRAWSGGVVAAMGVISSVGGPWRAAGGPGEVERVIRTDVTPYSGLTGGALLGADGSLLAVGTGILLRGLSLAIPAAIAWPIADMLAREGGVRRAFLGIGVEPVALPESQYPDGPRRALVVVRVLDDSPARRAGLMIGDLVLSFDGHQTADPEGLLALLTGDLVDRRVPIEIVRGGQRQKVDVTLARRGKPEERRTR